MYKKKELAPIVESYGVSLSRRTAGAGKVYYVGSCPFHGEDRNPSFAVYENEDEQASRWLCFACAPEGGDVIDFVMRMTNCSFTAAVAIACDEGPDNTTVRNRLETRKRDEWIDAEVISFWFLANKPAARRMPKVMLGFFQEFMRAILTEDLAELYLIKVELESVVEEDV